MRRAKQNSLFKLYESRYLHGAAIPLPAGILEEKGDGKMLLPDFPSPKFVPVDATPLLEVRS